MGRDDDDRDDRDDRGPRGDRPQAVSPDVAELIRYMAVNLVDKPDETKYFY